MKTCEEPGCTEQIDEKYKYCYPHQLAKKVAAGIPVKEKTKSAWIDGNLMVWSISQPDPKELCKLVNGFARRRKVRATQIYPEGADVEGSKTMWNAFVYFEPTKEDIDDRDFTGGKQ